MHIWLCYIYSCTDMYLVATYLQQLVGESFQWKCRWRKFFSDQFAIHFQKQPPKSLTSQIIQTKLKIIDTHSHYIAYYGVYNEQNSPCCKISHNILFNFQLQSLEKLLGSIIIRLQSYVMKWISFKRIVLEGTVSIEASTGAQNLMDELTTTNTNIQ